jgi:hypothetical protein
VGLFGIDIVKQVKNNNVVSDTVFQNLEKNFNTGVFNTQTYNLNTDSLYSGIDWVYTYVETIYMYDYNILYFWLLNNIYDESMDFFFISL